MLITQLNIHFSFDKTIPSVPELTWPIDIVTNDNTPLMQWNDSTDSGSGIAGYRYLVQYRCTDASDINSCTAVYPNSIGLWLTSSQYQAGTTADGTYYWQVRAQDNAGNEGDWSNPVHYFYDATAPTGTVSYSTLLPTQGPVVATLTPSEAVTITDAGGSFTHSFSENGSFTFHFVDAAGNTGETTATVSNIDNVAPVVSITAPTTSLFNGNIEIRGTVTDTNPHHYWLVIQNSSNVTVAGPGTVNDSASFTDKSFFTWDTTSVADGTYTIKLEARDAANNKDSGSVSWKTITLDKTLPTSVITLPSNTETNQTVFSNSWDGTITGTANDNIEVDHVLLSIQRSSDNLFWDGATWTVGTESSVRLWASNTNSWSYILPNPIEGTYIITSHAVDTVGNVENSYSVTIVVDKTIPEVAISLNPATPDADNGWYKTQPEVTLTATDTNFSIVEYQWNGEVDGSWIEYTGSFKPTSEGAHTLYYRAWDLANNVSGTGIKNIKWDQTELKDGPINVSADPNPTSGSISKIKWEAANDNVGIDKYEVRWYLNGGTSSQDHTISVGSDVREKEIDQLEEGRWTVSVRAFDSAGHNKDAAIDLYVDRTAPVAPTLVLGATGEGTVDLSWNSISDAKDYIIWYGTTSGGPRLYGARVGLTTSYTVQGLGAGDYYFIIRSVDEAQNQSEESNEVNTGTIIGAPEVEEGTPAEGFAPEVLGSDTEATPAVTVENPEVLGDTTEKNNSWMWWLLLLLIPLYFGVRKVTKKG